MSGKSSEVLYASAARTATPTAVSRRVDRYRGCVLIVDITAGSTLSVTPKIEGVDSAGNVYTLLTGTALTGAGVTALRVYPGIAASNNVAASDVLPQNIKVTLTHGNSNSATYSVDLVLIP